MIDQNRPIVAEREDLARFVVRKRWIRTDNTIKQDAFIPPSDLNLSVTRHANLSEELLWERGHRVANQLGNALFGRADVSVTDVHGVGLEAVEYPVADNPEHAHIVDWPPQKPAQKNKAQELAARSAFIPVDLVE